MTRHRLYVLDLDGTVYRGDEATPGAGEAVHELKRRGAAVRYFTNNSAARPEAVAAKLRAMGVPAEPGDVLSSGQIAARFLADGGSRRVMVVGEPGLHETVAEAGMEPVTTGPADALLVGICRTLTYGLLDTALQVVRGGAPFVATNRDATYPLSEGRVQPGAGAMVAAVEACTGVTPRVVGKPDPAGIRLLMDGLGVSPAETLVVGDRPETDLAAGAAAGCATWLVLTGVTPTPVPGQAGSPDLRGLLD